MARIPFVERAYGQDELARRHRLVGFCVVQPDARARRAHHRSATRAGDGTNVVAEFVRPGPRLPRHAAGRRRAPLRWSWSSSTSRAGRAARLRYESWHLLHLYAYLGVGLALPHQLWTGAGLPDAARWPRVYWWTLWAAAAAAILVWRVGLPLYRSLRHRPRGRRASCPRAPDVVSVVHDAAAPATGCRCSAGQFFTWRFLDGPGWTRGNPYSLSAAPTARPPADHRRRTSATAAGRLARCGPGPGCSSRARTAGCTAGVRTRRKVTLLAGGIGITPLRALLEELPQGPGDVTLVYRARTQATTRPRGGARHARRGQRAPGSGTPSAPGSRTGAAWLPAVRRAPGRRRGAAAPRAGRRRARRLHLRRRGLDGRRPRRLPRAPACPPDRIHLERFAW